MSMNRGVRVVFFLKRKLEERVGRNYFGALQMTQGSHVSD